MDSSKNNKQYKDSVFVDLFSHDQYAAENFMSLYNALHDTNLDVKTTRITPLYLEQVLYMTFYNDVSCLVDDKIIVLAEHQSTVNENMPLRFLEYITRLYEQLQNPRDRYLRRLVKIPTPEFYVFYNGIEEYPETKTLHLSDAFLLESQPIQLELTVKVININQTKHSELLTKCKPLEEYSLFVEIVRRHLKHDRETGFKKAVEECLKHNILKEYLHRKSREVMNMLLAEYDYATDIAVQRQEERQLALQEGKLEGKLEGLREGELKGLREGELKGLREGELKGKLETAIKLKRRGMTMSEIADITGLSVEEIEKL